MARRLGNWDARTVVRAEGPLSRYAYRLQGKGRRWDATYLPAFNQVWVHPRAPKKDIPALLGHEFFHVYLSATQPAHLLPLRGYLDRMTDPVGAERFRDIVEATCLLAPGVRQGILPTISALESSEGPYAPLAVRILRASRRLAATGRGFATFNLALRESLLGMIFLLAHIFPLRWPVGNLVTSCIGEMNVPEWRNRWELFFQIHRGLAERAQHETEIADTFRLALPVGPHRSIGELVVFVERILDASEFAFDKLVATLPSLLGLLSLGSFVVMPVIRLRDEKQAYKAMVTIAHSTTRSEAALREVLKVQSGWLEKVREQRRECLSTQLFLEVLNHFQPFRLSHEKDRLRRSMQSFAVFLPKILKPILSGKHTCPGCRDCLSAPTVASAARTLADAPRQRFSCLSEAAGQYESWLRNGLPPLVKRLCEFRKPVRFRKMYRHL